MDKILMHMPCPFPQELTSGAHVRPYHMCDAFLELGYEVELIAGSMSVKTEQVYRRSATAVIPRFRFYGVGDGFQGEGA